MFYSWLSIGIAIENFNKSFKKNRGSGSPPKCNQLVLGPRPPLHLSVSVHNFLSNPVDRQTHKQSNKRTNRHR